jgi:hypothetical protein
MLIHPDISTGVLYMRRLRREERKRIAEKERCR